MKIDIDKERWNRIGGGVCLVLLILQGAVFMMSWIISAINPDLHVHSLLGGEGIRWFFGNFLTIIGSGGAAWLILLLIAVGAVMKSGIIATLAKWWRKEPLTYREKYALRASIVTLLIFAVILLGMTCTKEAVLLSASGDLFPSSFSKAVIPVIAFAMTSIAIVFGSLSAQLSSLGEVFKALSYGPQAGASLFVIYVFVCQFVASTTYAFLS